MNIKDENMDGASSQFLGDENETIFLASLPKANPYRVPEQYFDDLQQRINQSVFLAELDQQKNHGFTLPESYFEKLPSQITGLISISTLQELVPNDGFDVPANYFEQLSNQINKKVHAKPVPKIIKLWRSSGLKYASVACLFIIVGAGLYLNDQHQLKDAANVELANEHLLYDIDENVIYEHLQESQSASSKEVANDAEMENYILTNFSSSELENNL